MLDIKDFKRRLNLTVVFGEEPIQCPFHKDDNPSLHIYHDHVYCYSCRKAADGITLVMELEDLEFMDAIEFLEPYLDQKPVQPEEQLADIPLSRIRQRTQALLISSEGLSYLESRGITRNTAIALSLGWDGRNITIPHFTNGRVENVKRRVLDGSLPKYFAMKNRKFSVPYPWDYFRKTHSGSPVLFMCEGEFDAMLLLQEGIPAMSAPSGADANWEPWVDYLKRFKMIVLLYDQDDGGERAATVLKEGKDGKTPVYKLLLPTKLVHYRWPKEWGKDVTDAREHLIPDLLSKYKKVRDA